MRSLDPALHRTGAHSSSPSLGPASGARCGGTGQGPRQTSLPLPETRLAWPGGHPRDSGVLDLRGACTWSQGKPLASRLSLADLDSASCQSRGVCHPLPTLPVPALHAHRPRLPEDKGRTTPTHSLSWPLTSPASLWLPEEGRTRFLLLVLTLCSPNAPPTPPPMTSPRPALSLKACGEAPLPQTGGGMEDGTVTQSLRSHGQGLFLRVGEVHLHCHPCSRLHPEENRGDITEAPFPPPHSCFSGVEIRPRLRGMESQSGLSGEEG